MSESPPSTDGYFFSGNAWYWNPSSVHRHWSESHPIPCGPLLRSASVLHIFFSFGKMGVLVQPDNLRRKMHYWPAPGCQRKRLEEHIELTVLSENLLCSTRALKRRVNMLRMLKMLLEKAFYLHVVPLTTISEAEAGGG